MQVCSRSVVRFYFTTLLRMMKDRSTCKGSVQDRFRIGLGSAPSHSAITYRETFPVHLAPGRYLTDSHRSPRDVQNHIPAPRLPGSPAPRVAEHHLSGLHR